MVQIDGSSAVDRPPGQECFTGGAFGAVVVSVQLHQFGLEVVAGGKDLPLETVNRMVSFFARHEVDKQAEGFSPGEEGYPSNGRIAWALWGGDPGKTWSENIANQDREDDEEDDKPRYNTAVLILQNLKKQI